ncbi:MAG: type II toxin-antitoxin system VapC family toxin [Xenococcus sp. MO_188.B8]|nr:type II toxin-antitoxin system VapC family toxin [Xenococcus sp. MO_188.B8]
MSDVVTDTHALIWYLEDSPRLSIAANRLFDQCERGEIIIYVPTICLVEIIYLQEKGRISSQLRTQLNRELMLGNTGMIVFELTTGVVEALATIPRDSVPDLPDRIIAATAVHLGLPLISRDSKIAASKVDTIW